MLFAGNCENKIKNKIEWQVLYTAKKWCNFFKDHHFWIRNGWSNSQQLVLNIHLEYENSITEEFGFSGWDNKKLNTCVIYMYTITKLFPHTLVYEHTPTCTQTPTSSMRKICFPQLPKKQNHMDYYFNTFT